MPEYRVMFLHPNGRPARVASKSLTWADMEKIGEFYFGEWGLDPDTAAEEPGDFCDCEPGEECDVCEADGATIWWVTEGMDEFISVARAYEVDDEGIQQLVDSLVSDPYFPLVTGANNQMVHYRRAFDTVVEDD